MKALLSQWTTLSVCISPTSTRLQYRPARARPPGLFSTTIRSTRACTSTASPARRTTTRLTAHPSAWRTKALSRARPFPRARSKLPALSLDDDTAARVSFISVRPVSKRQATHEGRRYWGCRSEQRYLVRCEHACARLLTNQNGSARPPTCTSESQTGVRDRTARHGQPAASCTASSHQVPGCAGTSLFAGSIPTPGALAAIVWLEILVSYARLGTSLGFPALARTCRRRPPSIAKRPRIFIQEGSHVFPAS